MKTKNLAIILFLLIVLVGGLAVFLSKEKNQPAASEQSGATEKQAESLDDEQAEAAPVASKQVVELEKAETPKPVSAPAEEKINAVMIISGLKHETEVKPGSSVYEMMNLLKNENKIDFSGKNYSGLGFFVEEINGLKNNPLGENWVYYVNGQPAPVGVSNYSIKNNDLIEWKYEKKSF